MKLQWDQSEYLGDVDEEPLIAHYGHTARGAELSVLLDNHYVDDTGGGMLRWKWTYESGTVELNGAVLAEKLEDAKQKAVEDMQQVMWYVWDEAAEIEA